MSTDPTAPRPGDAPGDSDPSGFDEQPPAPGERLVGQTGQDVEDASPRRSRVPAALRAMRPKQWTKNVLVFTAPLADGSLFQPAVLGRAALAFVAFCLISACIYLINDIRDVEEDRLHPRKRYRPIAAGELRVGAAWVLAAITGVLALVIGFATSIQLGIVLVVYAVLQILYSLFFKHEPVIDLAMVASGFLLRAIAGGVATDIPLSQWFLLVAAFGSLFMVAGKRYSEMVALGAEAGTRRSLERYSSSYLRFAWMLAASVTVMAYALWAFEQTRANPQLWDIPWAVLSVIPLTLGLLQYAREVDSGDAGEPEDVVLRHRSLQVTGAVWLILVAVGVFA
ncbi:decaprenyl-phosphate phosphoribosyltransferase [Naumannella cuiyingiana]|uniref:Decaprenyl-phosphate phosphoribosyltransferase n=1 Tax=Naumannella cuiyingiana TaxID=1347891 RepID=A0A7Z0D7A7_9ACTN|nr:decaprenyl-phosphate phosphoribosyltransferase [Naumannella cuiyingiana]NYI70225.1 decaprenyl-phosphate phosphoribosyltransferase [Naumannella cuiyingiana]